MPQEFPILSVLFLKVLALQRGDNEWLNVSLNPPTMACLASQGHPKR